MTSGQAFQLVAVISQQLGKIGLGFDGAKLLIDKPSITRRRLKALSGENPSLIVPQYQYATLERLDADPDAFHRGDDCGEYLIFNRDLEAIFARPDKLVTKYGHSEKPRKVYRCDVIRSLSEEDGYLYPVFREAMLYNGPDDCLWETLFKRRALWTVSAVLGFLRDEIHCGDDPLGLTEADEEAIFPVLLTQEEGQYAGSSDYPERVGALLVSRLAPVRQKRGWRVALSETSGIPLHNMKLIFFANNPQPTAE